MPVIVSNVIKKGMDYANVYVSNVLVSNLSSMNVCRIVIVVVMVLLN